MYYPYTLTQGLSSYPVPKKELKVHGCFTILDVRRSIHEHRCDQALKVVKNDMAHYFYENPCDVLPSTENKLSGNWVALAMPNVIPSRLGLMTRVSSLMILCGDAEQALPISTKATAIISTALSTRNLEAAASNLSLTDHASDCHMTTPSTQTSRTKAASNLLNPMIHSLLATDYTSGLEILDAWRAHYQDLAFISESPTSLAEYLHTCSRKFPSKPWMALLRHALGLHLHKKELEAIQPAVEAAMQSVSLTRDYWAWPKISRGADNNKRVGNAVAALMAEHGCAEAEALNLVHDAVVVAEERFLDLKADVTEALGDGQSEVVMFLDAVEQFAGGNSLWFSSCPRFHGRC